MCGSFRIVSKVMGATVWCLGVHLAFDVLANVIHIDKSCPPTMFSNSICIMLRENNQKHNHTHNQTLVRLRIGGKPL